MNNSEQLVSLVMAVRNERGGLAAAVLELERLKGYRLELIFVEGGSTDGTYEELLRVAALPHRHTVKVLKQDGTGKKDAVVKGLKNANGTLAFVFDNDGEIASGELPKFIEALKADRGLFLNSNRFILPMEKRMSLLNRLGSKFFAIVMSVSTGSHLGDSLCGLKGTWTENYQKMISNGVFGNDLDRFAEFDQLFGAKRLGLRIRELPVTYRNRRYGESKVERFKVGWQLVKRIGYEYFYRLGLVKTGLAPVRETPKDGTAINQTKSSKRWRLEYVIFAAFFLAITVLSFQNLLTYPRIWQDEASTIEQSHNVLRYGIPDIEVAPGNLTGVPHLIQSTGYPVEVLLALVFKIFGYGFSQARIFMLAWTLLALFLVFYLAKRFFGGASAVLAFLLIASFSSFYNSGRTVVGEIPGFVFLLVGLAYLMRDRYVATGLFFGFAVVTKPSVFGIVIPAIVLTFLAHREGLFKKLSSVFTGMIPAALLWFIIVTEGVVNVKIFKEILRTYSNPFGASQSVNLLTNLSDFFQSPTLIYFSILFLVVLISRYVNGRSKIAVLYDFVLGYSFLAFLYYLRSPGWLRYILIAELLILFLIPHAVLSLAGRYLGRLHRGPIKWQRIAAGAVAVLVCIHLYRFSTSANIFYSDAVIKTAEYLNREYPNNSVAVVNSLPLSVLLHQPAQYKVITTGFVIPNGAPDTALVDPKPLSITPPVDVFVIPSDRAIEPADEKVLSGNYRFVSEINGYKIYRHK